MARLPEIRLVEPDIWRKCAGDCVKIPPAGSIVYYFPEGHAEQASTPAGLPRGHPIAVLARVLSVQRLADPLTDEVFARFVLSPLPSSDVAAGGGDGGIGGDGDDPDERVLSFNKTLTPSDANNGGGFSVPRACADTIFPALDYEAEPPVQNIRILDIHGVMWEFRHIFRGTPRRHLLTTGWSKFVNNKKLVSGDCVVFIRDRNGDLFVGIRRTGRFALADGREAGEVEGGFSRCSRGRVRAESVLEAVERAVAGREFEVEYYPRAGLPEFVVRAAVVDEAMKVSWASGMQVRMAVDSEETGKVEHVMGKIQLACSVDRSPWLMLEVNWDNNAQVSTKVNPWKVQLVSVPPHLPAAFPPMKKVRIPSDGEFEFLPNGDGPGIFPVTSNGMMQHFTPSLFGYNHFPVGMQGARHDVPSVPNLSNFLSNNHQVLQPEDMYSIDPSPILSGMSSFFQKKNPSQVQNPSPRNLGRDHTLEADPFGSPNSDSSAKSSSGSIQLFGKIIQMNVNGECKTDSVGNRCNKAEVAGGSPDLPTSSGSSLSPLYKKIAVTSQGHNPLR